MPFPAWVIRTSRMISCAVRIPTPALAVWLTIVILAYRAKNRDYGQIDFERGYWAGHGTDLLLHLRGIPVHRSAGGQQSHAPANRYDDGPESGRAGGSDGRRDRIHRCPGPLLQDPPCTVILTTDLHRSTQICTK